MTDQEQFDKECFDMEFKVLSGNTKDWLIRRIMEERKHHIKMIHRNIDFQNLLKQKLAEVICLVNGFIDYNHLPGDVYDPRAEEKEDLMISCDSYIDFWKMTNEVMEKYGWKEDLKANGYSCFSKDERQIWIFMDVKDNNYHHWIECKGEFIISGGFFLQDLESHLEDTKYKCGPQVLSVSTLED